MCILILYSIIQIQITDPDGNFKLMKENETLYFENSTESFDLKQVDAKCFKLNGTIGQISGSSQFSKSLNIRFPYPSLIPESVQAFFTSEENSYGTYQREWFDGEVFERILNPGHYIIVSLKPIRYNYLKQDGQCTDKTFVEQWMPHLSKANFSTCPNARKCSHHASFVTKNISLCGWGQANAYWRQCGEKVIDDNYKDFKTTVGFKRPCQILEYSGQLNFDKPRADKDTIFLKFQFSPPVMTVFYQERLVFDTVGMLGSIGGTLGMCIGFSFSGITSTFLDFVKSNMKSYF